MVTGAAVVLVAGRLRYHEADEVRAGIRRNIVDRKLRIANHVRVRRASLALSNARSLGDLFGAVREMLESGEWVYAAMQLGRPGSSQALETALSKGDDDWRLRNTQIRDEFVCWDWERGDVNGREVKGSPLFWSLRLPLSGWGYINLYREFSSDELLLDVNYMSSMFQRELVRAIERIFADPAEASELAERERGDAVASMARAAGQP
jgi:hypothetical protein